MAAPPLDSTCDGPVTYPGDTKLLETSSKGRSGPTLNTKINKITKIQFYKYEHIVVKFVCEFFGCDYCVLLTINIL